jgi:hypothetical protein
MLIVIHCPTMNEETILNVFLWEVLECKPDAFRKSRMSACSGAICGLIKNKALAM